MKIELGIRQLRLGLDVLAKVLLVARSARRAFRLVGLLSFVLVFPLIKRVSKKTWLFNLDCHISVIADLKEGFKAFPEAQLVSWSLSNHNWVFRSVFIDPDPVLGVNVKSWRNPSARQLETFRRIYGKFLSAFDGFVVTYPVSFLSLFEPYGKPILAVAATRYEHPFTERPSDWKKLNKSILRLCESGLLTLVANNKGDADYIHAHTSLVVDVVPSLCDYIPASAKAGQEPKYVVFCKNRKLESDLVERLGKQWCARKAAFGARYSWKSFSNLGAVLYIPYNVSTMTLFELATLNVTVFVPTPSFMQKLADQHGNLMGELSFSSSSKLREEEFSTDSALAAKSAPESLIWWIERADFYQRELMPNVIQVNSVKEIHDYHDNPRQNKARFAAIEARNSRLAIQRHRMLHEFLSRTLAEGNGKS